MNNRSAGEPGKKMNKHSKCFITLGGIESRANISGIENDYK
jgi:hypothetical protein